MRFLTQLSLPKRILLGGAIFAISQLCFFATRSTDVWVWITVTAVFSIGEAILLPNLNILLDQLAPAEHRGAYLGASTLTTLGVAVGPLIGGVMLAMTGAGVIYRHSNTLPAVVHDYVCLQDQHAGAFAGFLMIEGPSCGCVRAVTWAHILAATVTWNCYTVYNYSVGGA